MQGVPVANKAYIFLVPLVIAFASFVMGYLLVYFTKVEDYLRQYHTYTLKDAEFYFDLTTTLLPVGAFISSLFYSKIVSKLGENRTMQLLDVVVAIGVLLQVITVWTPVLCVSRLLIGCFCGITFGLVPSFIVSITPSFYRGITGTFSQIALTTGIAFAYLMGQSLDDHYFSQRTALRVFLGLPLICTVLHFVLITFMFKFDSLERMILEKNYKQLGLFMKQLYGRHWRTYMEEVKLYGMWPHTKIKRKVIEYKKKIKEQEKQKKEELKKQQESMREQQMKEKKSKIEQVGETAKQMTGLDDLGEQVHQIAKNKQQYDSPRSPDKPKSPKSPNSVQSPAKNDKTDQPLNQNADIPPQMINKPLCQFKTYMMTGMVLAVANQMSGSTVLFEYAKQLFLVIYDNKQDEADVALIVMGVFQVVVTSCSCICISRIGRRPVMLVGQLVVIVALIGGFFSTLLVDSHEVITTALVYLHVFGFSISLGPIFMLYAAEALKGIQPVLMVFWALASVLTLISDFLIDSAGSTLLFAVFTVFSIATWVYLFQRMPQSRKTPRLRLWRLIEGEQDQNQSKQLRPSRGQEMVAESNTQIHKRDLEEDPQPHEAL